MHKQAFTIQFYCSHQLLVLLITAQAWSEKAPRSLKKPWEQTAAVTVDVAADAAAVAVAVAVAFAFAVAVAVADTFRMGGDHESYKAL